MLSAIIYNLRNILTMLFFKQLKKLEVNFSWSSHTEVCVLKFSLLFYSKDRDQTVSQRFEPSSRNALIGEQPNP